MLIVKNGNPLQNRAHCLFRIALPRRGRSGGWRDLLAALGGSLYYLVAGCLVGASGSFLFRQKAARFLPVHSGLHLDRVGVVVGGGAEQLGSGPPPGGPRHF